MGYAKSVFLVMVLTCCFQCKDEGMSNLDIVDVAEEKLADIIDVGVDVSDVPGSDCFAMCVEPDWIGADGCGSCSCPDGWKESSYWHSDEGMVTFSCFDPEVVCPPYCEGGGCGGVWFYNGRCPLDDHNFMVPPDCDCGSCPEGQECVIDYVFEQAGTCCAPDCETNECGSDGCNGWCGNCGVNEICQYSSKSQGKKCVHKCPEDCVEGDLECGTGNPVIRTCVLDKFECWVWSDFEDCPPSQICQPETGCGCEYGKCDVNADPADLKDGCYLPGSYTHDWWACIDSCCFPQPEGE